MEITLDLCPTCVAYKLKACFERYENLHESSLNHQSPDGPQRDTPWRNPDPSRECSFFRSRFDGSEKGSYTSVALVNGLQ